MKIRPVDNPLIRRTYQQEAPRQSGGFDRILKTMVSETDMLQTRSASMSNAAISGQPVEAHSVMIAGEEARIAFDLMIAVRNKLIDAYRELMQMRM
ncbi:MAG: flagellar hook-basal body complex protein FliE [Candidatus Krumholzibacteriota bacterium]|nr:flagellar hook-basal body complex protein FliE [Candidatus Krumholzibacteriota bacterium]